MLLFLAVVVLVLGGGVAFLSHRLAFAPRWRWRPVRWVVPAVLVALTGMSFLQFGAGPTFVSPAVARPFVWVGATWLALALYLVLGLVLVALVSLVAGTARRAVVNRVGVGVALVAALGLTGLGVVRANDPVVTPVTFRSTDLPASFDGVTVALVTDLHAGPVLSAGFTRRVVDRVNAARADLVLLSGDLVDGPVDRYGPELAPLTGLRAPLGVYAVTGNHEMFSASIEGWEREWQRLGVTVVSNTVVEVRRGPHRVAVGGVHDWSGVGAVAPDYAAATAEVVADDFAIVLAHQPRAATRLDADLVDLQVSGHTHGGQLWPFRRLVLSQQPVIDGLAAVNGIPVLTSRGAGSWGPPVRVGADPEIPLITLRRG